MCRTDDSDGGFWAPPIEEETEGFDEEEDLCP